MKILFTGITGNLSYWMNPFLTDISKNHSVKIISRREKTHFFIDDLTNEILNINLNQAFILNEELDIVFHGAFILPYNIDIPKNEYILQNVNMLNNLLKSLKNKPKKFIFLSTNAINEPLYNEKKIMYAIAKQKCEEIIFNYCQMNEIQCIVLRLPPLIYHWKLFTYELKKLKHFISIFPINKNNNVTFISQLDTFYQILHFTFFDALPQFTVISFVFNPNLLFKEKIKWLKKISCSRSIVIFCPIKPKYQLKKYSPYEKIWELNPQKEMSLQKQIVINNEF